MSLVDEPPLWYAVLAMLWSAFQGVRGVVETRIGLRDTGWKDWQKVIVLDIHDFVYRFVCTVAGFASLLVSFRIAAALPGGGDFSAGGAALLVSCFLIGVVGVGGQLHYLLLLGNLPGAKH